LETLRDSEMIVFLCKPEALSFLELLQFCEGEPETFGDIKIRTRDFQIIFGQLTMLLIEDIKLRDSFYRLPKSPINSRRFRRRIKSLRPLGKKKKRRADCESVLLKIRESEAE